MVPRIVFTDVDGTLLDHEHRCVGASMGVIEELRRRGIPFVLVSARMPEALYPIQSELGFHGPLVCYSGAYVLDEAGDELLSRTIDLERAIEVKRLLSEELPDICCSTYGFHSWVCDDGSDERIIHEERIVRVLSTESSVAKAFDGRGVHKFLLMGEPDQILEAERRVSAACPDLTVVRSSDTLCEVMAKGVSKAEGIRVLLEHCGVDLSRAVAFGDGCNDVDMLAAVPESYAMANGAEEAKLVAAHVTDQDNDHNGLAETLMSLLGN